MLRGGLIKYSSINKSNRFLAQHHNIYGNHRQTSTIYDENKNNVQKSIRATNEINKFKKIAYFKENAIDFYQKLVGFNEMETFHAGIFKTQV